MNVFADYARYYDLLYKDKNYASEAAFVRDRLMTGPDRPATVLELGCGTGRHAIELARLGLTATGIDLSAEMVAQAQAQAARSGFGDLRFEVGDVRSWRNSGQWDAVISLFHVMSYQTTNEDLLAEIRTAATHLRPGGLFFFDFWYGPAVLTDPPAVRVKRMTDDVIDVVRLAEPVSDSAANLVTVNYDILVTNRQTGALDRTRESHRMRYLFLPEMEFLLQAGGFALAGSGAWLSLAPASEDSWYAWILARRQ